MVEEDLVRASWQVVEPAHELRLIGMGRQAVKRQDLRLDRTIGAERQDGGRFSPQVALRFLADLHVPVFVWDLSGPISDPPPGWGRMRPVDNVDDLVRAVRRVRSQLEDQRVVWLNGRHLPQNVELSDKAEGIRLAD